MDSDTRPVYLHVGLMKSGTTYLQQLLRANASEALAGGVGVFPKKKGVGFRMALDLRGIAGGANRPGGKGSFNRFGARLRRTPGERLVFSEEVLAGCTPEQIDRLGEALAGREVHVIITLRDVARTVPSMWQQAIKSARAIGYPDYVEAVVARQGRGAHQFWSAQDAPAILERWSALAPAERIHVVTVPHAGAPRSRLLERFCSVLDLDPTRLSHEPRRANESLGRTQVEVLRRINERLPDRARRGDRYGRLIRRPFGFAVLAEQPRDSIGLPREYAEWCRERSDETIAAIRSGGYHVIGDLDDLQPDESVYVDGFQSVDEDAVAESAVDALATLMTKRVDDHIAQQEERRKAAARARRDRASDQMQAAMMSEPSRGRVRALGLRAVRRIRSLT